MPNPNTITGHETPQPGQPVRPPGLSALGKMRWGVKHPPSDPTVSFAGKTVLVIGSNTGLGFEAALKYSALGASKLILGVRTAEKGNATKARILSRTGRSPDSITYLTVDLDTFASVQAFCQALEKEVSPSGLDVALLCAGVAPPAWRASPEGWELALQVNVLSAALLARLVVPILKKTGKKGGVPPRLTFVNSTGNDMVKREWFEKEFGGSALKMVNDREGWNSFRSYTVIKLMGLVVMRDVARQTAGGGAGEGPEVIVNAVCPGMCKTDLGRDHPWVQKVIMAGASPFIHRTAEEGGRSLVSATALGPESHGKFWHNDLLYP
jgi:NAD(P)-dependent dehydrogenase (short-subunit alcohol dehydrogenase family)